MEEKKADNKILKYNSKINSIDQQIENKHREMSRLDTIEKEAYELKKSFSKCIEMLNESIKGGNITNVLNSLEDNNNMCFSNINKKVYEEKENVNKSIKELYKEKEYLEKDRGGLFENSTNKDKEDI